MLKAAGKPGKATFTVKSGADGIAIGALAIDAGALMVRGTRAARRRRRADRARSSRSCAFRRATISSSTCRAARPMKATLRGASFDARDVVKAFFGHDAGELGPQGPRPRRQGRRGARRQRAVDLAIRAGAAPPRRRRQDAAGVGRAGPGRAQRAAATNPARCVVRAEDAGALSKFLDLYSHLEGGTLELSAARRARRRRMAWRRLRNFILRNETALQAHGRGGAVPAPRSATPTTAAPERSITTSCASIA